MDQSNQAQFDGILSELNRHSRELKSIRELMTKFVNDMSNAESEIPESMRRFMNYFHDLHDIKFVYEELGHAAPPYILRELERLDDRFRQLLTRHHTDGGTFEKVRREMAEDPDNRWDHTRLLFPPKEKKDETRTSEQGRVRELQEGANPDGEEPSGGGADGDSPADVGHSSPSPSGRRV